MISDMKDGRVTFTARSVEAGKEMICAICTKNAQSGNGTLGPFGVCNNCHKELGSIGWEWNVKGFNSSIYKAETGKALIGEVPKVIPIVYTSPSEWVTIQFQCRTHPYDGTKVCALCLNPPLKYGFKYCGLCINCFGVLHKDGWRDSLTEQPDGVTHQLKPINKPTPTPIPFKVSMVKFIRNSPTCQACGASKRNTNYACIACAELAYKNGLRLGTQTDDEIITAIVKIVKGNSEKKEEAKVEERPKFVSRFDHKDRKWVKPHGDVHLHELYNSNDQRRLGKPMYPSDAYESRPTLLTAKEFVHPRSLKGRVNVAELSAPDMCGDDVGGDP